MKQMILETVSTTHYVAVYATDARDNSKRLLIAKYYPRGDRLALMGFFGTTIYENSNQIVSHIRKLIMEVNEKWKV